MRLTPWLLRASASVIAPRFLCGFVERLHELREPHQRMFKAASGQESLWGQGNSLERRDCLGVVPFPACDFHALSSRQHTAKDLSSS